MTLILHAAPRHECLQDSDCDKKASCMGKPQGNQCVCNTGYSGNGKSCTGEIFDVVDTKKSH